MAELKMDFAKMAEGFTKTAKEKGMFVGWWIPVSEKLPEDGTWNLFTDGKQISVERFKLDAVNHFFPEGRWFSFDEAVAWMPLPQPYKAESEE